METKQLDPIAPVTEQNGQNIPESPPNTPKKSKKVKKKRFKEGRRIRTLPVMNALMPYIMKHRNDALNYFSDSIDITNTERYIAEKRKQGMENFTIMHLFIAAYVRAVAEKPGINRFVRGQRIYARNNIEVMLTIKKQMTAESPDTIVKFHPEPTDTAAEVYERMNKVIEESRQTDETGFDNLMNVLGYIPGILFRFVVWVLFCLDYWRLLPRFLTNLSPFHGSYFITSMGSLGIPPIYHHIYNFGNVPLFTSFGAKYKKYELQANGSVKEKRMIDYKIVMDERICDGFYYASALKLMRHYIKHPEKLDIPPKVVVRDID